MSIAIRFTVNWYSASGWQAVMWCRRIGWIA